MRRPLLSFVSLLVATLVLGSSFEARGEGQAGSGGQGNGDNAGGSGGSKDKDTKPPTCEDACDKVASGCVDTCEETHKGKPLPRVKCKLACGDARRTCVEACGKK